MTLIRLTVAGGIVAVPAHFIFRAGRGDYPVDGDSIAIPIFFYLFFYPFECNALRGLKHYRAGDSLLYFGHSRPIKRLLSTLGLLPVCYWSIALWVDSIDAGLLLGVLFYTFRLYAFLLLRCALMRSYAAH
jgi:hypothetical protein